MRTAHVLRSLLIGVVTCLGAGCGAPAAQSPVGDAPAVSPLGPSWMLQPAPSDDDALLGRVLVALPEAGRSLDELSQPNPCADKLAPARSSAMANVYENAEDVSVRAKAGATLSMFGFGADAQRATHLVYKLSTSKQVARTDTAEYQACCREQACGVGYVAALVYGEGEYAAAESTSARGQANIALATAEGEAHFRVLRRRNVRGYVAALVRVTDAKSTLGGLDPLGGLMAQTGVTLSSLSAQAKELYEREEVELSKGVFVVGKTRGLTENEFVRRYRRVTGRDDLDPYEFHRQKLAVWLWGGGAVVAAGLTTFGLAKLPWVRPDTKSICGEVACTMGLVGAPVTVGLTTAAAITYFLGKDGSPSERSMSDYDAQLAVGRYNRALLRKGVQDLTRQQSSGAGPTLRWGPGPGRDQGPSSLEVRSDDSPSPLSSRLCPRPRAGYRLVRRRPVRARQGRRDNPRSRARARVATRLQRRWAHVRPGKGLLRGPPHWRPRRLATPGRRGRRRSLDRERRVV